MSASCYIAALLSASLIRKMLWLETWYFKLEFKNASQIFSKDEQTVLLKHPLMNFILENIRIILFSRGYDNWDLILIEGLFYLIRILVPRCLICLHLLIKHSVSTVLIQIFFCQPCKNDKTRLSEAYHKVESATFSKFSVAVLFNIAWLGHFICSQQLQRGFQCKWKHVFGLPLIKSYWSIMFCKDGGINDSLLKPHCQVINILPSSICQHICNTKSWLGCWKDLCPFYSRSRIECNLF